MATELPSDAETQPIIRDDLVEARVAELRDLIRSYRPPEVTEPSGPLPASYVYVIGSTATRLVKIGRTSDVGRRLASIQSMCPVPLRVLWFTPGGSPLELWLHRQFTRYRQHGEWFDFGDDDPVRIVRASLARPSEDAQTR